MTGNFWLEDDQADTLATGDVSKFSELVDWSALAAGDTTAEPQPTGSSARWYVSRLDPGAGQRTDDGNLFYGFVQWKDPVVLQQNHALAGEFVRELTVSFGVRFGIWSSSVGNQLRRIKHAQLEAGSK